MTYFSTFSGVGGFEIALEKLGHECVGYSEVDKTALAVYQHHFPHHTPYGDITKIDAASLPAFDLFIGGFPCQSHSVAGKRGGLTDDRGQLFWDVVRILKEKQPSWFILENVAGLLSSEGGRAMGTIIGALVDIGYGVAYRVLDAQHAGVPQRRRRVFLVGHLGDERAGEVLALTEGLLGNPAARGKTRKDLATDATGCTRSAIAVDFRNTRLAGNVAGTLQAKANGGQSLNYMTGVLETAIGLNARQDPDSWADHTGPIDTDGATQAIAFNVRGRDGGAQAELDAAGLASLRASAGGSSRTFIAAISENQRAEVLETEIVPTLKAGGGKPGQGYAAVRMSSVVRRLTATECERLMSWPDGWTRYGKYDSATSPRRGLDLGEWNGGRTFEVSDSQRYKLCGNGVVSNVVYEVASRLTAIHNHLLNVA